MIMSFKKMFTLIELIVVIVVLGILAAIVIPNISSFQKEAESTAVVSNVRNLQTSSDMYALKNNGDLPALSGEPTEFIPLPLDFEELSPEFTRTIPKGNSYYWIDAWGKVWASNIDSPRNVRWDSNSPTTLLWDDIEEADYYNIYKVLNPMPTSSTIHSNTKLELIGDTKQNITEGLDSNTHYVVSAIDTEGFETAPVGPDYKGYEEYITEPVISPESPVSSSLDNKQLSLDGSDDYVDIPLTAFPETMTDITIEFWAKPTMSKETSVLVANGDDPSNRLNIHFAWNNGVIYWDFGNALVDGRMTTTFDPAWYNVNAHWTFTAEEGTGMAIYRNGVKLANSTTSSTFFKQQKVLNIGKYNYNGYWSYWKGDIDELRIWNHARSQEEIQSNMNISVSPSSNGLLGQWKFDEGTGSTVKDYSKGNNGTIYGTSWTNRQ